MIMDIDTLETIRRERHQALMHYVEQARLLQMQTASDTSTLATALTPPKPNNAWTTLQQKLFTVFQMRIRTVLPH